ncbi:MAG: hypothetical protein WC875_06110 [Candidatus Absconditabacterales bacterium]|jgi:uncharacterized FlgJ-related protein
MTKQNVVHGMKRLEKAFNKQYSQGQVEIWIEKFSSWKEKDFFKHVEGCIEKCIFLPTIADVFNQRQESILQPQINREYIDRPELTPEQEKEAEAGRKRFSALAKTI